MQLILHALQVLCAAQHMYYAYNFSHYKNRPAQLFLRGVL